MKNELYHYGVPQRSGRYPWGSGKNPYHHGASLSSGVKKVTGAIRNQRTKTYNKSMYAKSKSMSDEELRSAINRIKLEQEYRSLKRMDLVDGKMAAYGILGEYGAQFIGGSSKEFSRNTLNTVSKTGKKVSAVKKVAKAAINVKRAAKPTTVSNFDRSDILAFQLKRNG